MGNYERAILKTLIYADIFSAPLTKKELWRFLINDPASDFHPTWYEFQQTVKKNIPYVEKNANWFALQSGKSLIADRKKRVQESRKKIKKAYSVASILSYIPSILYIGISGGVAVYNAQEDDDIDLFIIVRRKTIWITRLVALFILQIIGQRRKRLEQKNVQDKICINMLIDEGHLTFSRNRHDLYTAHEIAQLYTLFDKKNIFTQFIQHNTWIFTYLPNSIKGASYTSISTTFLHTISNTFRFLLVVPFMELLAKEVQIWYMKKYITKEKVTSTYIAFHPYDYRQYTLREYARKLKQYGKI